MLENQVGPTQKASDTIETQTNEFSEFLPFNSPTYTGKELTYIEEVVVKNRKISGNGPFTRRCHDYFKQEFQFPHCLLTTSCTDALEMAALLSELGPGDEVILPSYTFVSTANAFVLRGATLKFADSLPDHPNIDPEEVEKLITPKTKAVCVVHYGGVAVHLKEIREICDRHNLKLIEDAAQAVGSKYRDQFLGTVGDFSTFSFHETKNVISGEGGLFVAKHKEDFLRAEVLWEKGTNRSAFQRGETNKYCWIDVGSSFLPSELVAAFLLAQIESHQAINQRRLDVWETYFKGLNRFAGDRGWKLPTNPTETQHNAHLFYIVFSSMDERNEAIQYLRDHGVASVFHYLSLHKSPFYTDKHDGRELPHCDMFADRLLRLPLFSRMHTGDAQRVVDLLEKFKN